MRKRKLLDELKNSYEKAAGSMGVVENQSKIMEAMKYIDSNFCDELDDQDIEEISNKYHYSVAVSEAIKEAKIIRVKKTDLIREIKEMYEIQDNPHKRKIEFSIFDAIDWINDNMPNELTEKDLDVIGARYEYDGEILNAIDNVE